MNMKLKFCNLDAMNIKISAMFKIKFIIPIVLAFLSVINAQTGIDDCFKNFQGTIVVYDQGADQYIIHNKKRAAIRFSPFSTYKIPHSIIALESGVITDTEQIIKWDTKKYPREKWWPKTWSGDHNLRSAIKFSVVPVYRHLAGLIGPKTMQGYVDRFDYGNKDISSGLDDFWLNGSLQISALEQIEFLKKFYNYQLPVSKKTIGQVKKILIREQTPAYKLSAKTGAGYIDPKQSLALGWYIGYLEKPGAVYFFALNIQGKGFTKLLKPRIEITKSVLKQLGILSNR